MSKEFRDLELKAGRSRGLVPKGALAKRRVAKRAMLRAENMPGRVGLRSLGAGMYGAPLGASPRQLRLDKIASYARGRFGAPLPFI